jgi:TRAP-type C4-dicarboxylate transport system permease large subunit
MTPRAARNRAIEGWLRWIIGGFYLWLGGQSLMVGAPLVPTWLAWKALMFGLIFVAAIMIDVTFKPVGAQLAAVMEKGSNDETEIPLRRTMDKTRIWVWMVYILLMITAFLGNVKPML